MTQDEPTGSQKPSRRGFVELCIGAMGATSAGAVAYPVVAFLGRPASVEGVTTIKVPVAELQEDQARYVDWQGQQIVILYTGRTPKVLSASCSHLGCLVAWDNVKHVFHCPCHGAVFDDQGRPVSGPVSKPLAAVPFQLSEGNVVIG
ncbi:MAG: ubiquinol-cytochrome c reductase iron-sulfur subunit [Phycisphaerae bacterium]|nr:ubiquinol-cytochrome c reductase iron-sulfur subunit [Phycisphaerae bacterium]